MTDSVRMQLLEERMTYGNGAFIVEPFDSVNIKRGLQFYMRVSWPDSDPIANGDANARYIYFKTGSKPVIVKSRVVSYVGEEFSLDIFSGPTITPETGTAVTVSNLNRIGPQPTTVEVIKDPAVTDEGSTIDQEPDFYFGGARRNFRVASSIPPGSERILPAESEFLVKIVSTVGAGRFSYRLEWFEGEIESFD